MRKHIGVRFLAGLMALFCLFFAFTASHAAGSFSHECEGKFCFLCLCSSVREHFLSSILPIGSGVILLTVLLRRERTWEDMIFPAFWTPVCLRVKLSD